MTTFGRRVLAVEVDDTALHKFGLAIDVGTTSVVTTLMELDSGEQLASVSSLNPQAVFGGDLMSRIAFAQFDAGNLRKLQTRIVGLLNQHIEQITPRVGRARQVDLQGRDRRQHLHAPPAPGHRPVLRGPGPVRPGDATAADPARARALPEAATRGARLPPAPGGRLRGRRRGRGGAGHPHRRVPRPPHRGRHRHQRRGPARLARASVGLLGARRPRARGRADPPRHARGLGRHRPRRARRRRPAPAHHRRRARAGPLRLGPGGRDRRLLDLGVLDWTGLIDVDGRDRLPAPLRARVEMRGEERLVVLARAGEHGALHEITPDPGRRAAGAALQGRDRLRAWPCSSTWPACRPSGWTS